MTDKVEDIITTVVFSALTLVCLALTAVLIKELIAPEPKVEIIHEAPAPAPDTLTEWQQLQLALILTESKGDATAVGKNNDYGILQITPIFVAEANRISGMAYTHEDAFDIDKSLQMFSIVHDYYNPDHDIAKAIKVHNPGSSGYAYRQNLELIRNMEAARKAVKGL